MKLLEPNEVRSLIEKAIPNSMALVEDLTGTKDHYKAIVVSSSFEGKILIERHQMINEALKEPLKGPIHALTIEAYTEAQWDEKKKVQQGPRGITF
jgi:stress-induced morphogen